MSATASPARRWTVIGVWCLVTLPFLSRLFIGATAHDVDVYWQSAKALLDGLVVYRDVPLEYPPYSLIFFIGPAAISTTLADFRIAFGVFIWAVDAAMKGTLVSIGAVDRDRPFDWKPVLFYALATATLGHLLLQRYDVIPAALAFAAFLALARRRAVTAGVLIALAAGVKIYPALFFPVMAIVAWRLGRATFGRFMAGAVVATLPMLVIGVWMPWWQFASQHISRGLEAESLWSSLVWLAHFAGVPATWNFVQAWNEVGGPVTAALVAPARLLWVVATVLAVVISARAAWRLEWPSDASRRTMTIDPARRAELAVLLLVPVATFVVLNPVLSPQFHLWLIPWCALAIGAGVRDRVPPSARAAAWCIMLSGLLVPIWYPTRAFAEGLDVWRTIGLVTRNGLLLYGTARLWRVTLEWPRRFD